MGDCRHRQWMDRRASGIVTKRRAPGEGTVYQRKDGSYEAAKTVGSSTKGNPRRVTAYGRTKAAALANLQKKIDKLGGAAMLPRIAETSKITVGQWVDSWLKYKTEVSNLKPNSIAAYGNTIAVHIKPAIGDKRLISLRPVDVEHMLTGIAAKGRSARTVRYAWQTLNAALRHAVRRQLITSNPAAEVEKPKPKGSQQDPPAAWSQVEAQTFIEAVKTDHYYPVYHLALTTGMRRGELVALQLHRDLSFKDGTISIRETQDIRGLVTLTKTDRSRRTIPLSTDDMEVLAKWLQRRSSTEDRLFTSPTGKIISPRNLYRSFKNSIRMINTTAKGKPIKPQPIRDITFHGLRHTYATLALRAGVPLTVVSKRLGHSDVAITLKTYAHVLADMEQAGALSFAELTAESATQRDAVQHDATRCNEDVN